MGGSIGIRIVNGLWPSAAYFGGFGLAMHSLAIGLGQISTETRLARSDLRRIATTGRVATTLIAVSPVVLSG